MARGKNQMNDSVNQEEAVEMTGVAVGTALDPETGRWLTTVIRFNHETGTAVIDKTVFSGLSKSEASEKFKILAVEEGIVV